MRRVVITGVGAVTPLGVGVRRTWARLLAGESGIVSLGNRAPAFESIPSQVAGLVPQGLGKEGGWNADEWLDRSDQRRMAKFTQYAMAAAEEAVQDSGSFPAPESERENMGVILGSGIGNFSDVYDTSLAFSAQGHHRTPPLFVPRLLINLAAGHLSTRYDLHGPNLAPSTACTTGLHSIIQAHHLIAHSPPSTAPSLMLAGAAESCIHPLAVSAFARARSLSTSYNECPTEASRPFDTHRDGFVIGEGAAIVVLEERERALKRGARIYAEIGGGGMSGDAGHMTKPREDGLGAVLAMKRALAETGDAMLAQGKETIREQEVEYVNAHATGTIVGDEVENRAVRQVLMGLNHAEHDRAERHFHSSGASINISSTKGATGHLLGAAGSLEAIFTTLAIHEGIMPSTLNLAQPGDVSGSAGGARTHTEWDLNYIRKTPLRSSRLEAALTNSFGFGGTNASLCLIKHKE